MITVISIGGLARSGKDTFAENVYKKINEIDPNFNPLRISLADALKEYVATKFNIPLADLYDPKTKPLHRNLLIAQGALKRSENRYFWAIELCKKVKMVAINLKLPLDGNMVVIVPDNRYLSELSLPAILKTYFPYQKVKQHTIYVSCPSEILKDRYESEEQYLKTITDPSETSLGEDDFAETILNDCDFNKFAEKAYCWVESKFKR